MTPGKLYISKKSAFHIWEDESYSKHIGYLSTDIPFIFIEFINLTTSIKDIRILTAEGNLGVIHSSYLNRDSFQEVKE